MNDVLTYILFALLFFIFRITVVIDKETFSDLEISKVTEKLVRYIVRIRRWRIAISTLVLAYCGGYIVFSYILPPIMNLFFRYFYPELCFVNVIPSNTELIIAICICLMLILSYCAERYLFKQLHKKYPDLK